MHRHQKHFPHTKTTESFIKSFSHTKLSGSLTALYSNRIIQQVAGGLVGLFFPILLYTKFNYSIYAVLAYYIASNVVWFFSVPIGAKIMSKIGLKKSLITSVCFGWMWYFFIRLFEINGGIIFLALSVIAVNFDRMFYWIPFHTDFAEFTNKKTRGKQMAFLIAIASVVSIFIPVFSGYVVGNYGFDILFLFAMLIYVMSVVPLLFIPDVRENYSFTYFQSYKKVFSKENRRSFLSYAADGVQDIVGTMIWPIFIWLLLDQQYGAVGFVSSVIIFVGLILQLAMGDFSDRFDKHRILKWGTILNAFGWITKMFIATGFQIFIASTYHSFANIVMRTPLDALMYEKAADSGHYVDEYTVVREISLLTGRLFMICLIGGIFFFSGSFIYAFLVAGVAALAINFI